MIGLLLLVVALAAVLAVFLLRDAAQADARRRRAEFLRTNPEALAIRNAFVRVQIAFGEALSPALAKVGAAVADLGKALEDLNKRGDR